MLRCHYMSDSVGCGVDYAWEKKQIVWNGHFLSACCIAVAVPSGKTWDGLCLCENAYSIFFFYLRLFWSSYLKRSAASGLPSSQQWKAQSLGQKICQLKCEILKLYDLLARIDRARWLYLFLLWLVTVMRDDIDAVVCVCVCVCVCMVLTVPTYLHPPP